MGQYQKMTKAELARQESDQRRPEFMEWLEPERMDSQLRKFLTETVPDMPENPFTVEGLNRAEAVALELMPGEDAPFPDDDITDQFVRFLGETFRRNFGGEWMNIPNWDRDETLGPVVHQEFAFTYRDPRQMLVVAISQRTGNEWSTMFEFATEDYTQWTAAGRPPMREWKPQLFG
ncbi:hypothetical protein [Nocardia transvalensis]|uniref:hypothetical protein n=1 Tax=Nocardia transvalensis TaxID=37333 RepID=UPI001895D044|nr:hypothetical protein [Nocardia transvalensis]MBF6333458.1 hypothetical protein [Nocardia transvalensis]